MPVQRGGYGLDTYSLSDYGTEGVIHDASATVIASSAVTAEGGRSLTGEAQTISALSAVVASALRARESSGLISASSAFTASGEDIIYEDTDTFAYGSGAYGLHEYTQGDLQVVFIGQTSSAVANVIRIRTADGTAGSTSGFTADSEQIYQGSAVANAVATAIANGAFTVSAQPDTIEATSVLSPNYIRERNTGGIASSTSAEVTIAREKWETISVSPTTWTPEDSASTTWTLVA